MAVQQPRTVAGAQTALNVAQPIGLGELRIVSGVLVTAIYTSLFYAHWHNVDFRWVQRTLLSVIGIYVLYLSYCRWQACAKIAKNSLTSTLPEQKLFLSLVIPSKNEACVLERLVRSIDKCTYPRDKMEVIIVDDCSDDNTNQIVTALQKEFGWLKLVDRKSMTCQGGGKSGAMNAAVSSISAHSKYVGYFDADASIFPDCFDQVVRAFAVSSNVRAVQVPRACDPAVCLLPIEKLQYWEVWLDFGLQQLRYYGGGLAELRGNGEFITIETLRELGWDSAWNQDSLTDDLDASLRLHMLGYTIALLPQVGLFDEPISNWSDLWAQRKRWCTGGYQRFLDYYSPLLLWNNYLKKWDMLFFFSIHYLFSIAFLPDLLFGFLFGQDPMLVNAATIGNILILSSAIAWIMKPALHLARLHWGAYSFPSLWGILSIFYAVNLSVGVIWASIQIPLCPRALAYAKSSHGNGAATTSAYNSTTSKTTSASSKVKTTKTVGTAADASLTKKTTPSCPDLNGHLLVFVILVIVVRTFNSNITSIAGFLHATFASGNE